MRYIDADNILYKDLSEGRGVCWVTFRDWINEMQTADVVEVVRCRDCKYHAEFSSKCNKLNLTPMWPNDYCSYGEEKEE